MSKTARQGVMLIGTLLSFQGAAAAEIRVNITGATSDTGTINCALFASEVGFPMDGNNAVQQSHTPINGAAVCSFKNLQAGSYAIGSVHDANSNGKTDTNFLGIPKEAWGVSNNVRPKLRAPAFKEAQFTVREGDSFTIEIFLER